MGRTYAILLAAAAVASPALGGTTYPVPPGGHWANEHLGNWRPDQPDYGFEFATIGNPGNRGVIESERVHPLSSHFFPNLGRVDHTYRISTTEVTASQWEPFFHAILPHYSAAGGSGFHNELRSEHITLGGPLGWEITPGEERSAVSVAWQFAARYCNWLHNGAPTGAAATLEVFQTGAYDMPTLAPTGDDTLMPLTHNADAKYWLPSVDEWIKAAHYDPDRYGEGEEGYWSWMGGRPEQLTPGLPWEGGETSAGSGDAFGDVELRGIPVAAYDVTSPWGLYDTSGQEMEWTESPGALVFFDGQILPENRYILGSGFDEPTILHADPLDGMLMLFMAGLSVNSPSPGFRIASAVPAPGGAGVLLLGAAAALRRRRNPATAALLLASAAASPALGGTTYPVPPGGHWANEHLGNWRPDQPDYGFEFATIGNPGNRGVIESERVHPLSSHFFPNIGRVDHTYRISTTEVTARQWEPFFHALLPHYTAVGGSGFDVEFSSEHISLGGPPRLGDHPGRGALRRGRELAVRGPLLQLAP